MNRWRLILAAPGRGSWNMAVDEAILAGIGRGESPPTLRLYAWDPPCLSLGYSQPFADVDGRRLQARGWEVVRRATGGRAILHTDELTYSLIGSEKEPVLAGGVLESYNRIAQALSLAVKSLGLPVELKERKAAESASANPVCFEVPSTYEITVNGKKLIGSAQARKKDGVLQHGSLPLTGDLSRICQALAFQNEEARQSAGQRLLRSAITVESARGHAVSWETAAQAFIRAFETQLGLCLESGELSRAERERAEALVSEKYDHASWTQRT